MKNTILLGTAVLALFISCQSNKTNNQEQSQTIAKEAIAIHDEIMPQIGLFDRTTVKIDSILNTSITDSAKQELTILKTNLELATENMMTWMKEYEADSVSTKYQEDELIKIKAMKKQFDDVSLESNTKLTQYK